MLIGNICKYRNRLTPYFDGVNRILYYSICRNKNLVIKQYLVTDNLYNLVS